jgi:hypothetical protein
VAAYGHQPLSEIMAMTVPDFEEFFTALMELVVEERKLNPLGGSM